MRKLRLAIFAFLLLNVQYNVHCMKTLKNLAYAKWFNLHDACIQGSLKKVKLLVKKRKLINKKDHQGNSPLHLAVANKHIQIVECLISQKNIELEEANNIGQTPFDIACANKSTIIAKMLFNAIMSKSKSPFCSTFQRGNTQAAATSINYLINILKFNINTDYEKPFFKPLQVACICKNEKLVNHLIQKFQEKDIDPFFQAITNGHLHTVKYLVKLKMYTLNHQHLEYAYEYGQKKIMRYIFNNLPDPFGQEFVKEHLEIIEYLLQKKIIDINRSYANNNHPLDIACKSEHKPLIKLLVKQFPYPLHDACKRGNLTTVKYLIKLKTCNINLHNAKQQTPLDITLKKIKPLIIKGEKIAENEKQRLEQLQEIADYLVTNKAESENRLKDTFDTDNCCICFDDFVTGFLVKQLQCKHVLCPNCTKKVKMCPLCRKPINKKKITTKQYITPSIQEKIERKPKITDEELIELGYEQDAITSTRKAMAKTIETIESVTIKENFNTSICNKKLLDAGFTREEIKKTQDEIERKIGTLINTLQDNLRLNTSYRQLKEMGYHMHLVFEAKKRILLSEKTKNILSEEIRELIQLIKKLKINVNKPLGQAQGSRGGGNTLIHQAVQRGNPRLIEQLLNLKDTDLTIRNNFGDTILDIACKNRQLAIAHRIFDKMNIAPIEVFCDACKHAKMITIAYLVECLKFDITKEYPNAGLPIDIAYKHDTDIACYIIKQLQKINQDPLTLALQNGEIEQVKLCIENMPNVYSVSLDLLRFICDQRHKVRLKRRKLVAKYIVKELEKKSRCPLYELCRLQEYELVKYLLDKKIVKLKLTYKKDKHPLDIACANKNLEIVKCLLNQRSSNPLHHACKRGKLQTIAFLVATMKYDMQTFNQLGKNPLEATLYTNKLENNIKLSIASYLLSQGAKSEKLVMPQAIGSKQCQRQRCHKRLKGFDKLGITHCKHVFCSSCISKFITPSRPAKKAKCPLCTKPINYKKLIYPLYKVPRQNELVPLQSSKPRKQKSSKTHKIKQNLIKKIEETIISKNFKISEHKLTKSGFKRKEIKQAQEEITKQLIALIAMLAETPALDNNQLKKMGYHKHLIAEAKNQIALSEAHNFIFPEKEIEALGSLEAQDMQDNRVLRQAHDRQEEEALRYGTKVPTQDNRGQFEEEEALRLPAYAAAQDDREEEEVEGETEEEEEEEKTPLGPPARSFTFPTAFESGPVINQEKEPKAPEEGHVGTYISDLEAHVNQQYTHTQVEIDILENIPEEEEDILEYISDQDSDDIDEYQYQPQKKREEEELDDE